MIGSTLSRVQTAEKLSIPQLQQAIQSGSIPAYMGVPLLEEKIQFEQRMRSAAAARMAQGQQPTIAEQVMDQAQMVDGGIDQIPIRTPELAGGGIVAFSAGDKVQSDEMLLEQAINSLVQRDPSINANFIRQAYASSPPERREQLLAQLRDREASKFARQGTGVPMTPNQGIAEADMDREASKFARQGTGVPGTPPKDTGIAPEMDEDKVMPDAGISSIPISPIIQRAGEMATALRGTEEAPSIPTIEQAGRQTSDLLRASGYDENVLGNIQKEIASQRESLAKDKVEARNFRLLEMGLGIMAGTSPNAFENIGKGAAPGLRGLASDIKDLQKAEREFKLAEQNLMLKQNDAAMGKAKITQGTIDKAQDRADKKAEKFDQLKADLAKTMLTTEAQERLARAAYSTKLTDFDKQWRLYSREAEARGETPTFTGFQTAIGDRPLTMKDALAAARQDLGAEGTIESRARQMVEDDRRYRAAQRGATGKTALSQQDQQALAWANSNPNDPRAKQIKEHLGVK
jgi:hypothetical protein